MDWQQSAPKAHRPGEGDKMTKKQQILINEFISLLPEDDKDVYEKIIYYLADLGYIPQKQKVKDFVLSFKHNINCKVIAKMGIRGQKGFLSIKFFACKNVSEKFIEALRKDIELRNGQYTVPLPITPDTASMVTNKCGYCGDICTGGGFGYYCKFSDDKIVSRCGAYPIIIPDIKEDETDEIKRVILEQHNYFLSIEPVMI